MMRTTGNPTRLTTTAWLAACALVAALIVTPSLRAASTPEDDPFPLNMATATPRDETTYSPAPLAIYDNRETNPEILALAAQALTMEQKVAQRMEIDMMKQTIMGLSVDLDPILWSPRTMISPFAALTGPAPNPSDWLMIMKNFIARHRAAFLLDPAELDHMEVVKNALFRGTQVRTVILRQKIAGVPVQGGLIRASIGPKGEIIAFSCTVVPDAPYNPWISNSIRTAPEALADLTRQMGIAEHFSTEVIEEKDGITSFPPPVACAGSPTSPRAEKFTLPLARNVLRPVWRITLPLPGSSQIQSITVDAESGTKYGLRDRVHYATNPYASNLCSPTLQYAPGGQQAASYQIFAKTTGTMTLLDDYFPASSPRPLTFHNALDGYQPTAISPTTKTLISLNPEASPLGWVYDQDGGVTTTLDGNNFIVRRYFHDIDDNYTRNSYSITAPYDSVITTNTYRAFHESYDLSKDMFDDPDRYTTKTLSGTATWVPTDSPNNRAAAIHAFYAANLVHDIFFACGLDEQHGAYQEWYFGEDGVGGAGDCLSVGQTRIYIHINIYYCGFISRPSYDDDNRNLYLPVMEGPSPLICDNADPSIKRRPSALDAHIIAHELTHAAFARFTGSYIDSPTANHYYAALHEGFADFVAMLLFERPDPAYANLYDDPLPVAISSYGSYLYRAPPISGEGPLAGCTYPNGAGNCSNVDNYLEPDLDPLLYPSGFVDNYYFGGRRFPYSYDMQDHNPLVFSNVTAPYTGSLPVSPMLEVLGGDRLTTDPHSVGEIWASALWDARYNYAQEFQPQANEEILGRLLPIIFLAMDMMDDEANMLLARDYVMQAARYHFSIDDILLSPVRCRIVKAFWDAFARRGMGRYATISGDSPNSYGTVTASFDNSGYEGLLACINSAEPSIWLLYE